MSFSKTPRAVEMLDSWKAQENQTQVSLTLPTVLGNRSAIPTFPPPHDGSHSTEQNQRKEALRRFAPLAAFRLIFQ